MKYFTPEHYNRGNSPNEEDLAGIEDEWERALQRYRRRWHKVKAALPPAVRRFDEQLICLHDARVLSMGRSDNLFVFFLETEPPGCKPVVLTFTLDAEPVIQTGTLANRLPSAPPCWLYEEWDLDRRKRPTFEVLLSNGWVVKLQFRVFEYLIADPVVPGANGATRQPAIETAPSA